MRKLTLLILPLVAAMSLSACVTDDYGRRHDGRGHHDRGDRHHGDRHHGERDGHGRHH